MSATVREIDGEHKQHFIGIVGINLFLEVFANVKIVENLLKFKRMIGKSSENFKTSMQQTPIQVGEYSFTILLEPNGFW